MIGRDKTEKKLGYQKMLNPIKILIVWFSLAKCHILIFYRQKSMRHEAFESTC